MARVSLALVFALVLVLPLLGSVLGQDNPWASVLDQASKAGISQDTIDQAQKVIGDGSAQKAAEDALGDEGSLGDWVQQADDVGTNGGSTPAASSPPEAQSGFLDDDDDDIDDSAAGAPQASSPSWASEEAPTSAPELAPVGSPNLAPKSAPTEAPEFAPSQAPYASSSYGF